MLSPTFAVLFETSLVESRTTPPSAAKRWIALTSITLQSCIVAALIAIPLLHPQALSFHIEAPAVLIPLPPKPPHEIVHVDHAATSSAIGHTLPTSGPALMPPLLSGPIVAHNEAPALVAINGLGDGDALPAFLGSSSTTHGPSVSVAQSRPAASIMHVSSGVSAGMLLTPIRPIYPAIAKAAHIEGSVVVEAIISQTGAIESLHVLRGPAMLQNAAIEAIRAARYQPYQLNGQPTAVQTTFTVIFKLGA